MFILETILWFAVALSILVVFHEMGHYLAGRMFNVKVLRFSVGFGHPLFSWRQGPDNTLWTLGSIPLGGFVDFLGMRSSVNAGETDGRAFYKQSIMARAIIILSGPLANFLLAILLYTAIFLVGVQTMKPILDAPPLNSYLVDRGIARGDRVVSLNGELVSTWPDLRWKVIKNSVGVKDINLEIASSKTGEINNIIIPSSVFASPDTDSNPLEKIGLSLYQVEFPPVVGEVISDGAASRSGILAGDNILSIGGTALNNWRHLVEIVRGIPGQNVVLSVDRLGTIRDIEVEIDSVEVDGGLVGRLGVKVSVPESTKSELTFARSFSLGDAVLESIKKTWDISIFSLKMLGKMLSGTAAITNLSGPVAIADYAGKTAKQGLMSFVGFLALISISLGVINLLPIPVLDGGWLVHLLVEWIKGSPISDKAFFITQTMGVSVISFVFVLALFNDLSRVFGA